MPSTWLKVSTTKTKTLNRSMCLPWLSHPCTHASHTLVDWKHYSISSTAVQRCTHLLICSIAVLNLFWPRTRFLSVMIFFSVMSGVAMGPSCSCLSLWDTLNKNYSNSTANQSVPEMYKDSSMMVLAHHQWATASFWTSSALCRTFILRWNSPIKCYCLTAV